MSSGGSGARGRGRGRGRAGDPGGGPSGSSSGGGRSGTPPTSPRGRAESTNRGSSNNSPSAQGAAGRGRGGPGFAPRGKCRDFWEFGTCRRGFECIFMHEQKPGAPEASESQAAEESNVDALSLEGMVSSLGIAASNLLKPREAHNHVKAFTQSLSNTPANRVEGFVRVFASVSPQNPHWNNESAQEFLEYIVNSDILLRIGEVLGWEHVTSQAGTSRDVLSFQRGFFPLLEFFSSSLIIKTTMHQNINKLYSVAKHNFDAIRTSIATSVSLMMARMDWKDASPTLSDTRRGNLHGILLFSTLTSFFSQYFKTFKNAVRDHPSLPTLVNDLSIWFDAWADAVRASSSTFADPIASMSPDVRRLTLKKMAEDIGQLCAIVDRELGVTNQRRQVARPSGLSPQHKRQAQLSRLEQAYVPPGHLRAEGPRHDNDSTAIADIRIAPTHKELMSPHPPALPYFVPGAPHHLPRGSMEKHLDIQFRLLREELLSTIRQSITVLNNDVDVIQGSTPRSKRRVTQLERLIDGKGGSYRTSGFDSVFFHMYTGVEFLRVQAEKRNFTINLRVHAPPGTPRDKEQKKRVEYWKHFRRLSLGSLVALMLVNPSDTHIFLGTIFSGSDDIAESAKANNTHIQLRISFFDPEVELYALRGEQVSQNRSTFALLIDNSVMYESLRPFLETLQSVEPTSIPFGGYIASEDSLTNVPVPPPRYSLNPGFTFDLQCLVGRDAPIQTLNTRDAGSVARVRAELARHSALNPSQAESIVDALTRQIALIQGPPGTGKSFTGKELLRVLFASKIKPIVLIAFTNHALDHMLTSILDGGITTRIVRLGSRSSDERISQYNLSKLESDAGRDSGLDSARRRANDNVKDLEKKMKDIMSSIQVPRMEWPLVQQYLEIHCLDMAEYFENPPTWIAHLRALHNRDSEDGEWLEVNNKKTDQESIDSTNVYGFWKRELDILLLQAIQVPPEGSLQSVDDMRGEFIASLGLKDLPQTPNPDSKPRTIDQLLDESVSPWDMNSLERAIVSEAWERQIRQQAYLTNLEEFEHARRDYKVACQNLNNIYDQARQKLIGNVDLIGCTTTGAAKLISLLTAISPKVLVVEEAGQVLESHILSALVPSVQHLIAIGDPQQLRPTLATYELSMDSERGNRLYKFDRSLMERLSDNGAPMSLINVQRRMRPDISCYVRNILYPTLSDHDIVQRYPHVQGMAEDVYFLSHTEKENGEEDSVSKHNKYEVKMICDLVVYLLKQGVYSGKGDIAVLCAYLGQLQKVRAALRGLKLAISLDDRDQDELVRLGEEAPAADSFEDVAVSQQIRLGTVDTFQGQEAKIVIISLVRNSGDFSAKSSIGFLKSVNRINVSVSRAKHGLYVLGNASNLRQNETWSNILSTMDEKGLVGSELSIVCPRHPSQRRSFSSPGQLPVLAPEGGCLGRCEFQLQCGHTCPSVCHPDLDQHKRMRCNEPCTRITCPRQHPCAKRCGDDCGKCEFPIYEVLLPCGHVIDMVRCYEYDDLAAVKCKVNVTKRLTNCEHDAVVECSRDPSHVTCKSVCGKQLSCCSRSCTARCHECRFLSAPSTKGYVERNQHIGHPCERLLYCQHRCGLSCSQDHECNNECRGICSQSCVHHSCRDPCSKPCPPCMEVCAWTCAHQSCLVPCGAICSRLPCDEPCSKLLECGHPCPSVCGEPCASQKCPACLPEDQKTAVVDFIMQRTVCELDPSSKDVSERLITLQCGHFFTVETLDGYCNMQSFYDVDGLTGTYKGVKAPPVDFQTPPTCPTCRGSITSLRYGRVTKRANLDILERNVASVMTKKLYKIGQTLSSIDFERLEKDAKEVKTGPEKPGDLKAVLEERDKLLKAADKTEDQPLGLAFLNLNRHGFTSTEFKAWKALIKDLLATYKLAVETAGTKGPHVKTYDAALSTLYRLELAKLFEDPLKAVDKPENAAMVEVDKKMGQPPHKADTRYQVEAFLTSLKIRLHIAHLARLRMEGLSSSTGTSTSRSAWVSFVDFLYETSIRDALRAREISRKSAALKQVAKCTVETLVIEAEHFAFRTLEDKDALERDNHDPVRRWKDSLVTKVEEQKRRIASELGAAKKVYVRAHPGWESDISILKQHIEWFDDTFGGRRDIISEKLASLKDCVLTNKGYNPLSDQEKQDIVKALDFGYRGHFYNCENGHTFVIGECGGAMQMARCPECGVLIGGSDHNLLASNTRAQEYENIAREQGGRDPHWAWGQGA